MTMNERNDFFESEPVKQLLAENHAAGYIYLRFNDVEFCDDDITDSLYEADDRCFIIYKYVERACQFIDDVVNDRFDLHTLNDEQFELLYRHFIEKHPYSSLLSKIRTYYLDSVMAQTFYVLPNYFTFKPKLFYYLDELTLDDAYTKLSDAIEVAKTYILLDKTDAEEVFKGKINKVADERKKIKELSK